VIAEEEEEDEEEEWDDDEEEECEEDDEDEWEDELEWLLLDDDEELELLDDELESVARRRLSELLVLLSTTDGPPSPEPKHDSFAPSKGGITKPPGSSVGTIW